MTLDKFRKDIAHIECGFADYYSHTCMAGIMDYCRTVLDECRCTMDDADLVEVLDTYYGAALRLQKEGEEVTIKKMLVETYRRLADNEPYKYAARLAMELNVLSSYYKGADALALNEEGIERLLLLDMQKYAGVDFELSECMKGAAWNCLDCKDYEKSRAYLDSALRIYQRAMDHFNMGYLYCYGYSTLYREIGDKNYTERYLLLAIEEIEQDSAENGRTDDHENILAEIKDRQLSIRNDGQRK